MPPGFECSRRRIRGTQEMVQHFLSMRQVMGVDSIFREVEVVEEVFLFEIRQEKSSPCKTRSGFCRGRVSLCHGSGRITGRECEMDIMVVVQCQTNLLEIVPALSSTGCFTRLLNRGEQQRDQNRDDGNDDQ
jgi:hypothetical protein